MTDHWYPKAIKRPITGALNTGYRARRVSMAELTRNGALSCQHSAEGYGGLFGLFNNPARRGSTHGWCSKLGVLEQYVPLNMTALGNGCPTGGSNRATGRTKAWAAKGQCNDMTLLAIEAEGVAGEPLTDAQVISIAGWWAWASVTYDMPIIRDVTVLRHYQFQNTACDSNRYPTDRIIVLATEPAKPIYDPSALPSLWGTLNFWFSGSEQAPGPFRGRDLRNWPLDIHLDRALAKHINDGILADLAAANAAEQGGQLAALIPSYADAVEGDVELCGLGEDAS